MLICIYADNHWSSYSSIVRSRGKKYSTRLENQIASLNWVEDLAEKRGCEKIVSLGDFFDKSELNSEEITALSDIGWHQDVPHVLIVGNHEISVGNSEYSTSHALGLLNKVDIISEPYSEQLDANCELCYLPYMTDAGNKTINDYFGERTKTRIVFSHNDIAGVQFGMYVSKDGIQVDSIEKDCDLFLNGHLHNKSDICTHAYNVGNITGQNFSEDALACTHCAVILDTETLKCEYVENPYAFNFYKFDFTACDKSCMDKCLSKLTKTSVVSIRVNDVDGDYVKSLINKEHHTNIIESRVVINFTKKEDTFDDKEQFLAQLDHIQQFHDFVLTNIGNDDVIKEELNILCK